MRYHVVGIGGMGMSAVARLLLARGDDVSGSDRGSWPLAEALAADGATVASSFAAANVEGADVVIRSSAYDDANPEVAAARAKSIPVWKREDAWRELAKGTRVVAVAGTHGKSTTSALAWSALRAGGLDPSLICGAVLRDLGTNAYAGGGDILVIEADEYDRAFLALEPEVALVTNVEHDHIDVFPTRADVEEAFVRFVAGIVPGGWLVACADEPAAARLAARGERELPGRQVATYGMASTAGYRVVDLRQGAGGVSFHLAGPFGVPVPISLRLAGAHNARNAAGALAAADAFGVPAIAAAQAFATFGGTERRLEELGSADGITVIDDYAHHPTEIRASIDAMRARNSGRVVVLFQPHTPSRLRAFFEDFVAALRTADERVVAETFSSAREAPDQRGGARELASRAGAAYVLDAESGARALAERARPGDLVLVLGAGDIRPAGVRLLELLRERATV
ncbi:MAG TPA: UDP-N-acetylmuramate--L-alanine ligase [Candidatus Limnocylindria bacterium]|jgi:UDP-N-acetylmuramate--alanine ligase|nr:UDP-N-acetylmuramate--L-alanine ligase [Candidatus Limnocylindria bacterium]